MMTTVDLDATLASIASFRIAADRASRALLAASGIESTTGNHHPVEKRMTTGGLHRLHVVLNDVVRGIDSLRTAR
jgi:hypothetical protein